MMSDEDIKEYHNIGKAIKHSDKYNYVSGTRVDDHGTRTYDVNGSRLPSVTTILGATKDHTDTGALCELQGHGGQGGQPR